MSNTNWKERELGALWLKQGRDFYTGSISIDGKSERVIVFTNKGTKDKPKKDNEPDLVIYKSEEFQGNTGASTNTQSDSSNSDELPAALAG